MATKEGYEYLPPHGVYEHRETVAEYVERKCAGASPEFRASARRFAETFVLVGYRRRREQGEEHRDAVIDIGNTFGFRVDEVERIVAEEPSPLDRQRRSGRVEGQTPP